MTDQLRYDGRVAIITGAGAGLGRQHALMFGARGAKVVVNDLGGDVSGGGKSSAAADAVVAEIKALGGEAVANYDSVEDGAKIVQTALDAFGTVDIVVNNAGILRDASFVKMTDADWDLVLRVHLAGTKSVSQAAWPILRAKGYGRIVMTTSAAGIYGNFGQANYAAAKLGIFGLANTLAEEGRPKNIHVNTIAPIAASRLTEAVFPAEFLANLKPEAVSPLVGWLAHEDCNETKGLFEVGAGYIAKLRWERTLGHNFGSDRSFTPDEVAGRWDRITDFTGAEHPAAVVDTMTTVARAASTTSRGGNEFIDLDAAEREELVLESSYDERDLAIYALGIGAARDPMDDSERKFVYELGAFNPLPTYGVMPQSNAMLESARDGGLKLPGMNFGFERLLHGEQFTELRAPLPRAAKLKHIFRFKEAYDKNPNAVVIFAVSSVDERGKEIVYNEMSCFVKGAGGWGGARGPAVEVNAPPSREPDAVIEEATDPNQTLLYRLSGDWNPLHADPEFAKAFGFERPILHGLCTYGHVGRHVVKAMLGNDPARFKSIRARFAEPVFPGETLVTRMWKDGESRVIVETSVKERGKIVIKNASVEFHDGFPATRDELRIDASATGTSSDADRIGASKIFSVIRDHVAAHPELAGKVKTLFQFELANPSSSWILDLKSGGGAVREGRAEKADCTISLDEAHLYTVVTAPLADVQKLFFRGDIKITGNVMASNELTVLQAIDLSAYTKTDQLQAEG